MARYFPDRASRNGISGHSTLKCTVTARGQLVNCEVLSETPPDMEFGKQSIALSKLFRLKPMTRDGVPVDGGSYTFSITWNAPKEE